VGGEKRKGREEKREKRKDNALLEAWGKEARRARRFAEEEEPQDPGTHSVPGDRHRGKKEEEEKRREKEMCGWVMEGLTPQRGELQVR